MHRWRSKHAETNNSQLRAHRGSRPTRGLLLRLLDDLRPLDAHQVAVPLRLRQVLGADVGVGGVRGVVLAVGRQALRDADAGAVELADDPLLLLAGRALGGRQDEVGGPPQRNWLLGEVKCWHHLVQVALQEVLRQGHELRLLWAVIRVDGAGAADGGDAPLFRLLVDDADERVHDAVVAQLALHDARAEPLIHELAARRLASLQVLARTL
mmetsp:Transcript_122896/g.348351  ORF Transcript_122896/g.348351 Transcript_122896/m.348351 type:complete len:211 (-) Transcript_122896:441-1073(-)